MFNFILRSLKRNFGVDKEYYRFIDDMFGFIPNNIELYKVALIHKSASISVSGHHINNERLEYLGDAVIESVTSDYLFIEFPDSDEGFLTQMRSKIVSRQSLNEMAQRIGLDRYLICHGGAAATQKHIYGDAFEAMMGAIYLDKGYDFVNRLLINDIYGKFLSISDLSDSENDFKSRLIEWCQKNKHMVVFRTRKGNNNARTGSPIFYTTVLIDNIEVGHGSGDSKKASEQNAAFSVSQTPGDEECAELLDKYDRLVGNAAEKDAGATENDAEGHSETKSRKKRRHRKRGGGDKNPEEHAHEMQNDTPAESEPAHEAEAAAEHHAANDIKAESAETVTDVAAEAPESEVEAKPAKRRGRRKGSKNKKTAETTEASAESASASETPAAEPEEVKAPKKRGRKPKAESAQKKAEGESAEPKPARRRGRPRKSESAEAQGSTETNAEPKPAKRRGRKPKSAHNNENGEAASTTEVGITNDSDNQ